MTTPAGRVANLLALPALIVLLAYLFAPRSISWAALPLPDWLRWFGLLLALDGFVLLQWAHVSLGKNWSDQPRMLARFGEAYEKYMQRTGALFPRRTERFSDSMRY